MEVPVHEGFYPLSKSLSGLTPGSNPRIKFPQGKFVLTFFSVVGNEKLWQHGKDLQFGLLFIFSILCCIV